jgi:hypothetical protein
MHGVRYKRIKTPPGLIPSSACIWTVVIGKIGDRYGHRGYINLYVFKLLIMAYMTDLPEEHCSQAGWQVISFLLRLGTRLCRMSRFILQPRESDIQQIIRLL